MNMYVASAIRKSRRNLLMKPTENRHSIDQEGDGILNVMRILRCNFSECKFIEMGEIINSCCMFVGKALEERPLSENETVRG